MPVSHIGLTVAHLPTSCSFFLSALQPLGYRFIGQQGNQIGLGIHDADFFLCQETPGIKAGAAHIAFSAPDRVAVRNFYAAALNAGGRPHGSPAVRDYDTNCFNAAILDFDGNSIEVVCRDDAFAADDSASVCQQSRVLTWRREVSGGLGDARSQISAGSVRSLGQKALVLANQTPRSSTSSVRSIPSPAAPKTVISQSAASDAPTLARTVSAPAPAALQQSSTLMADDGARKIIGTLLGAAAGAAVAYAMCKSEQESAREEAAAWAASQTGGSQRAPSVVQKQLQAAATRAQSMAPSRCEEEAPAYEPSQSRACRRNFSETESHYSTPNREMRAIEAAPTGASRAPTLVDYVPSQAPRSQAPSRAPTLSQQQQQPAHRNFSDTDSFYSTPDPQGRYNRALENAPATAKSYRSPTYVSVPYTSRTSKEDDAEYVPASSVGGPRSNYSAKRSVTAPSTLPASSVAYDRVPSRQPSEHHSKAPSQSPSKAPSTLISSFVPDEQAAPARSNAGSTASSHRSSKSKVRSLISSFVPDSKYDRVTEVVEEDRSDYPPPMPLERRTSIASHHSSKSKSVAIPAASNVSRHSNREPETVALPASRATSLASTTPKPTNTASSLIGSILGRDRRSEDETGKPTNPFRDDDVDTVAPSDSISNVGSSGTRRSSRSHHSRSHHSHSHHSHNHSHSHSSRHSSHSHSHSRHSGSGRSRHGSAREASPTAHSEARSARSGASRRTSNSRGVASGGKGLEGAEVVKASAVSEPSDASTVRPYKREGKERKDSVVSLPVVGTAGGGEGERERERKGRSVVSFAG